MRLCGQVTTGIGNRHGRTQECVSLSSETNSSVREAGVSTAKGASGGVVGALTGGFRSRPDLPAPVLLYSWLAIVLLGSCGLQFAGVTGAVAAVLAACGAVLFLLGATARAGSRTRPKARMCARSPISSSVRRTGRS